MLVHGGPRLGLQISRPVASLGFRRAGLVWTIMSAFAVLLTVSASSFPQSPIVGHYVIAGQVLDDQGRALAEAQVTALPDQLIGKAPIATTDKAGKFTIEANKTGKWMLVVSKLSAGYPSNYFRYFYPEDRFRTEVTVPESGVVDP